MRKDYALFTIENPDTQYEWPQVGSWSITNKFLPRPAPPKGQLPQARAKQAHFFASPVDNAIMPWESCLFGRYTEVATLDEIETNFMNFAVVNMTRTLEYQGDTFGLRTLHERGGLHLERLLYDEYIYPALK